MLGGLGCGCLPGNPAFGEEAQAQENAPQPQEIDQKAGPPADPRQQPCQQGGNDAPQLVHGRGDPQEGGLLLRREVVGEQPGGQGHEDPHPHPHQGPHHQDQADLVKESGGAAPRGVEGQPQQHQGAGVQPPAELGEEEVGDDDEQRGDADDHLDKGLAALGKVGLNHVQGRGHSGACHHRQQREGEDAPGEPPPDGFGLQQTIASFLIFFSQKKMRKSCLDLRISATQHL